jgi:ADP-heptose:LPS heptosyltransferase
MNRSSLKVLIVDESYMGDVLLSTAGYREIAKHFPTCEVLTRPESKEVVEHSPIKRVHTSWKTIGRPDVAIHLHTSLKTNLKLMFKRIPVRIGYSYRWAGLPLTVKVPIPHRTIRKGYRVDEVCNLLEKAFGWTITNREMSWS